MPPRKGTSQRLKNASRSSAPRAAYCQTCKRHIISAIYDAWPITFDPQPLTVEGEVLSLLRENRTWFIAGGHLSKRNWWAIKTSPRGLGGIVIQEHRCDVPQPTGAAVKWPEPRSDEPGF